MSARGRAALHFGAAYGVALAVTLAERFGFGDSPLPRFADLYIPGIALLCCRYSWRAAALLLLVSVGLTAYALAPIDLQDTIRMSMFAITGTLIIAILESLKRKRTSTGRR
ncbi:MAG: hypothetical protein ABSH44_13925 [Bryobacteraceae bacterium]|jgi:hypothetical protein